MEMTVGKIEQLTHEQKVLRARENADESFSKLKDENDTLRSRVAELEGLLRRSRREMEQAVECNSIACPGCDLNFAILIDDIAAALDRKEKK